MSPAIPMKACTLDKREQGQPFPMVRNRQDLVALSAGGEVLWRVPIVAEADREAGALTGEDIGQTNNYWFSFLPRPIVSGEHLWAYSNDPVSPMGSRFRRQRVLADGTAAQVLVDATPNEVDDVAVAEDGIPSKPVEPATRAACMDRCTVKSRSV